MSLLMSDDLFEWITIKEYAAARGVHHQTVRRWIKLGYVTAKRHGDAPESPWRIKVVRVEQKAS